VSKQIEAEVIADSINTVTGDRLTTVRIYCPKWLLAEINTHRVLSRNFSSSRAIPARKIRKQVLESPVIPVYFGANQKGMQADEELTGWRLAIAKKLWLWARIPAIAFHWMGDRLGLHKQILNRLLEPWMWAEGVLSATEWRNFFKLRCHTDAQPEFRQLAELIRVATEHSKPMNVKPGQWHMPFVDVGEDSLDILKKISVARCARVSYYLRDGKYSTIGMDSELCDRLSLSGHWSPFEHVAQACDKRDRHGNYVGWKQYRKFFEEESGGDYVGF